MVKVHWRRNLSRASRSRESASAKVQGTQSEKERRRCYGLLVFDPRSLREKPKEVLDSLFKVNDRGKTKKWRRGGSYSTGALRTAPRCARSEAPTLNVCGRRLRARSRVTEARVWVDQVIAATSRMDCLDGWAGALQRRTAEMFRISANSWTSCML